MAQKPRKRLTNLKKLLPQTSTLHQGRRLSPTAEKTPARRARSSSRVAEGLMLGACPTSGHLVELFRRTSYVAFRASKMKGSEPERP